MEKEASESQYWLELCEMGEIGESDERKKLLKESGELLAIFTTIGKSTKFRNRKLNSKSEIRNPK